MTNIFLDDCKREGNEWKSLVKTKWQKEEGWKIFVLMALVKQPQDRKGFGVLLDCCTDGGNCSKWRLH
jgi:hypothetical protein